MDQTIELDDAVDVNQDALIIYTSGTTGFTHFSL